MDNFKVAQTGLMWVYFKKTVSIQWNICSFTLFTNVNSEIGANINLWHYAQSIILEMFLISCMRNQKIIEAVCCCIK